MYTALILQHLVAMFLVWRAEHARWGVVRCAMCLFYPLAPMIGACTGREQYRQAIDGLRLQQPLQFRPVADVLAKAAFATITCVTVIIKGVTFSVSQLAADTTVGGPRSDFYLDQSQVIASIFIVTLVLSILSVVYQVYSSTAALIAMKVPVPEASARALKQHLEEIEVDWRTPGAVEGCISAASDKVIES